MPIAFDGPSLLITLESGDTTVEVAEIYSRWKDWVLLNPGYPEAFRAVGGDPLGGGLFSGINTFIRNDLGWRIKPPEEDIDITLVGNLYPEDPNNPWRAPTVGDFDTSINTTNSANVLLVDSGGGGGGGASANDIAAAVWNRSMNGHTTLGTFGDRMRKLIIWRG